MNLALVIAVTAGGLAALGWAVRLVVRGPRLPAIPLAYLGALAFTWVAMTSKTGGYRPEAPGDEMADTRPATGPIDDYVTSDTCRSCHPGEYHSWHRSYHRTMTQLAGDESIKGDFDGGHVADFNGMTVRLSRDDEGYWATYAFPDPGGAGFRGYGKRRIVMTTGSHHYQVYWTDRPWVTGEKSGDRAVWLVPSVYLFDEKQWVPRHASFLMPPTDDPESHRWNLSCIRCHSTHGIERPDPAGQTHDSRAVELGISCEACHGPAKAHIEANRDPLRRYRLHREGNGDPTIVNPARLDHRRSADTCGQCHSIFVPPTIEAIESWKTEGRDYRPGQDINEAYLIMHPGTEAVKVHEEMFPKFFSDRFWSDGMVRVAGREYHGLLNTPCFQRGEMSCLSCHSLHKKPDDLRSDLDWADDQLLPGMRSNAACLQCHPSFSDAEALSRHTHHAPASAGSLCYNCHMPHTTYGLLKGIRSHQIDSPSVKASLDTGRPNACNLCHLDRTLAWTSRTLSEWYGQTPPELGADEKTVAASLLWLLTGDAGQRALTASAMGREDPREISGTDWMPPFLAQLGKDPYHAVRIISNQSLRSIEGYADLGRYPDTGKAGDEAYELWKRRRSERRDAPALLLDADGKIRQSEMRRLLERRDDRPINLKE